MPDARYSTTTQRRLCSKRLNSLTCMKMSNFQQKRGPVATTIEINNHFNSGNYFNSGRYFDSGCNRPTDLNGHKSIRNVTLHSCQKGSYLHINNPIIERINFNRGELHSNLFVKIQFMPCILLNLHHQYGLLPL